MGEDSARSEFPAGPGQPDQANEPSRPDQADQVMPRPTPRRLGELPFLLVLAGFAVGLTIVGMHHFKRGSVLIAAALVFGAVLRLVLPARQAGLLAVRGRAFDVLTLAALGAGMALIAVLVPPPS